MGTTLPGFHKFLEAQQEDRPTHRAVRECLRVLRDGGVLISDDCYAYTDGVSEMSRTSIKHNRQIVRVLQPHVSEVLYDAETPSRERWIERVGQLALRVSKSNNES